MTEEQYAAMAAGTFAGLYIGGFWTIGGVNYRIAAFNYFLNTGDTTCTKPHTLIVPDKKLYNAVMNDTNTTAGGYVGSKMYKEGLDQAKDTIKAAFPGHIVKHRLSLTNAVTNGRASGSAWFDSEVDLMTERMVYGPGIFSPVSDGITVPEDLPIEKSQLPLFAAAPQFVHDRDSWWLRDVVSGDRFANKDIAGRAYNYPASYALGVRPYFCIG